MRILLFAALAAALPGVSSAQSFGVGSNAINLGVGVGGYGYSYINRGYGRYAVSPSLSLSYEHGVAELGPGVVGVGGYLARRTARYERTYTAGPHLYQEDRRWSNTLLGIRGSWHFNAWHGNDRLDLYGGVMLGVNLVGYTNRSTRTTNGVVEAWDDGYLYRSGYAAFSLFAGARYYFGERFGGFAEVGYGIAWLNVGACLRF